jgi:hypothetical protein
MPATSRRLTTIYRCNSSRIKPNEEAVRGGLVGNEKETTKVITLLALPEVNSDRCHRARSAVFRLVQLGI